MTIRPSMTYAALVVGVTGLILFSGELFVAATGGDLGRQAPAGAQQPTPGGGGTPAGTPPPGQGAPGGRGGGRGNQAALLFTSTCSGCHGTPELTGRAPWLFDQKWLDGTDDEKIANTIRHGVPDKGMVGFTADQLSDAQVFQLIAY